MYLSGENKGSQRELADLQRRIGYRFTDEDLLARALTHRSASALNNERLEFLGDSILSFLVSAYLCRCLEHVHEGKLSMLRAFLVNGETLASLAERLKIGQCLILGPGEKVDGGRHRQSILANALEAIIGAIHTDSGIERCEQVVMHWFQPLLSDLDADKNYKNPKSELQEWLQCKHRPLPKYTIVYREGKVHDMLFHVRCEIEGLDSEVVCVAASRRKAEQKAAARALHLLRHGRS